MTEDGSHKTDATSNVHNNIFYSYNKTKSTISQAIAVLIGNIIMLQFGMSIAISTVVNGELTSNSLNSGEKLSLNAHEASWYGSLLLIFHPLGSLLSMFIQDRYGRKACISLVSVPEFLGWFSLYMANSSFLLYFSSSCLGIAMGLSEAPILTYIGECVEPRIRSGLASFTVFCSMIGLFITFILAALLCWRQLAFFYLFLPIAVFLVTVSIIPESPIWLLSKHQNKQATKSLCWLRGFTNANAVRDELEYMQDFISHRNKNDDVFRKGYTKRILFFIDFIQKKLVVFKDKNVIRTFLMVNIVFIFCTISAMLPAKPYLHILMKQIGQPISIEWALVFVGSGTLLGAFLNIFSVKLIGKKKLLIISILISVSCQLALGLCAVCATKLFAINSWVPFILFCCISFISGYGITPIPWILLGEIFPMNCRGILSGITAALNSVFAFCVTKTYLDVVYFCSLPLTFIIYGFISIIGIPYIYYNVPETENKTLKQIQLDLEIQ